MDRTWTSWRSRSTDARCAAMARRVSNARRCWRCCSPSAVPCSRRGRRPPLMLLDDVMSELDARRRAQLAKRLGGGRPGRADRDRARPPARRLRAHRGGATRGRGDRLACRRGVRERPSSPRERLAARRARSPPRSARARAHAEPLTLLAAAQSAWPAAAGARVAAEAEPVAERDGVVTIACRSATWAQELDLLQPELLERLNEALSEAGRSRRRAARQGASLHRRRAPGTSIEARDPFYA